MNSVKHALHWMRYDASADGDVWWTDMETSGADGMLAVYLIGALVGILWIFLPFAVFRIRREAIQQNRLLKQLIDKVDK